MKEIVALVLGGGRGTRLSPLTDYRAKPAVPLAGKYRLVDVPISNCIHNGIFNIYVLTQFESASLNRHISLTYHFDNFHGGRVEVLAAEERHVPHPGWFQGTADAVRQTLHHTLAGGVQHVLILAGDALYRMDFVDMLRQHLTSESDLTVACKTVDASQATEFGIMQVDLANQIVNFREKPSAEELAGLAMDPQTLQRNGLNDPTKPYLASMGIYIFRSKVLEAMLEDSKHIDFGKHIIPTCIESQRVFAYPFDGYWEDVGTIRSYYQANLELTDDLPGFNLYDAERPIYTRQRFLPGTKLLHSNIERTIMGEGCIINGARINRSVIGVRSVINPEAHLDNVVMNGADFYEGSLLTRERRKRPASVPLGIGRGTYVRNAIIDKNARIGAGVRIMNAANVQQYEDEVYAIRDGLVIVKKGAEILDGTVI